jgi:holliday junction resolvase Hjr
MSRKGKGVSAERELIHLFHKAVGWSAIRVAGSGSSKYPSPDVLAGNAERCIAIECKSTRDDRKYLLKEDVEQLKMFGQRFGAEVWIAVRFLGMPWYFLKPEEMDDTGRSLAISKEHAKMQGRSFEELVNIGISVRKI